MPENFINEYYSLMTDFFNKKQQTLDYNDDKSIKENFEKLYNKDLNILFGYYEILRKYENSITAQYYVKEKDYKSLNLLRRNVYNFTYLGLPKDPESNYITDKFIDEIELELKNENRSFSQDFLVPKAFRYSNYFYSKKNVDIRETVRYENLISDFYNKTSIQKDVCLKYPYYVVLNEEIYFFLYLGKLFGNENVEEYVKQLRDASKNYGLKQLIKFSQSIAEICLGDEILAQKMMELLVVQNYREIGYREAINGKILDELDISEFVCLMNQIAKSFVVKFRKHLSRESTFKEMSDRDFVKAVARFHFAPYLYLLEEGCEFLPDFFVFPIFNNYKNVNENILQTTCLPLRPKEQVRLNNPVLFSCFIKPIFQITDCKQYDETKESMDGFVITKILAKELAAPVIQSEFFGPQILNLVYPQAIKSSLAAVMSRNMSHNIGSHVLNKLSSAAEIEKFFGLKQEKRFVRGESHKEKNNFFKFPDLSITSEELNKDKAKEEDKEKTPLEEFYEKIKNNPEYLEQYSFYTHIKGKPIYKLSPYFVDVNNNTTKEELARVFNDYLKKRMDFVADVATSNKALLNSNKYLFADIFRGFERNLLLLHNISGKEDKFSYQFQFQYCDGSKDEKGNLITHNYYHYKKDEKNRKLILDQDNNGVPKRNNNFIDPIVAVPNDVLGSQAFYIILENVIRNTAKHSGSGNVIFTIKVEDLKEDDFYRITVFDNAPHTDIKKLVADRNVSIAQDLLNENNQIRSAGWGTIEIKLAACYLSGLDMLEMDNKTYWPIGYRAYTTAKEEALKEASENEESIEEKKHYEKAIEKYINFLSKSDEVILNEKNEYPIDLPETKKRVYLKDNNKVVRYPIVQAVDGSVDETSGFGYSFLMKKPKKLLIIDEADSLEFLEKEKNEELTALKRLGIDIIKTPKRDSIYNHQFMIIVGDENSEHYGDWFNLPQERLLFSIENNSFNNFKFCLKQNCFLLDSNFEYKSFSKGGLPAELLESLKFRIKDKLVPCGAYQIIYENYYGRLENQDTPVYIPEIKINDEKVAAKLSTTFDSELGKVKLKKTASFNHHGLSFKNFENADYAEIYGSTSPLGLYIESVCGRVSEDIAQNYELEIQLKHFIAKGANTPILVIDERIQSVLHQNGCAVEAGEETKEGKKKPYPAYNIKYEDLFAKSNITVLPVGIKLKDQTKGKSNLSLDLNSSNLKDKKINILNYIEKVTNDNSFKYLVIHYGIIEGLRDTSKKETVYSILQEVESSIKSANCQVVITSGRGYTPDIRSLDRYFVNYSTVSNFLLDPYYRSKSHFVECLQQLRKSN